MVTSSESVEPTENEIANLWAVLESCINIMDELQDAYSRSGEQENKDSVAVEAEGLESEINKVIETAESLIKELVKKKQMASNNQTVPHTPPHMTGQSAYSPANNPSSSPQHSGNCSQRLKPLKVPIFNGEKANLRISGGCLRVLWIKGKSHQTSKWHDLDRVLLEVLLKQ